MEFVDLFKYLSEWGFLERETYLGPVVFFKCYHGEMWLFTWREHKLNLEAVY